MARYQGPALSKSQWRWLWASGNARKFKHNWVPKGLYKTLPGSTGDTHGRHMGTGKRTGFKDPQKGHVQKMVSGVHSSKTPRHTF